MPNKINRQETKHLFNWLTPKNKKAKMGGRNKTKIFTVSVSLILLFLSCSETISTDPDGVVLNSWPKYTSSTTPLTLINNNWYAVNLSGWTLGYYEEVSYTIPDSTILAGGEIYTYPDTALDFLDHFGLVVILDSLGTLVDGWTFQDD